MIIFTPQRLPLVFHRVLVCRFGLVWGIIIVLLFQALGVSAQQPPVQKPLNTLPQPGTATGKAKQNIAQLKKLKLIETLDLDEQTAEKFFVRYNSEQKKVDEATKAVNESLRQLEQALQKKSAPDQIRQLTDQTLDKRMQLYSAITERYRSVRSVLNEQQYAKFLVFEQRFQEQLRRTILDAKRDTKKEVDAAQKK